MAHRRAEALSRRRLYGLIAGTAMVAAVTGLLDVLEPYVLPLHLLALYLLVVLVVAMVWGTVLAVVTSVLSVVAYLYLFARPYGFENADSQTAVALAAFLVTAVVVGRLAARLRHAALVSAQLSREQSALRRIATLVARSAQPSRVYEAVTREVGLLYGADLACMERYEADGSVRSVATWSRRSGPGPPSVGTRPALDGLDVAREVRRTCDSVRVEDFRYVTGSIAREARALGIRSSVACPILVAGRVWGVIVTAKKSDDPFPANTEAQIAAFTDLVAIAIENAEANAELAASRARIVTAADGARRRIEHDLHDGVQQRLVTLLIRLNNAETTVPSDLDGLDGLRTELHDVAGGLRDAFDELREVARGIHPAILAQGGLAPALKALARRSAIPVELDVHVEERLSEPVEVSAYYVVSEALTNAVKHAQATVVTVRVEADSKLLRVQVHDDGVGGADLAAGGTGLVGLKDRVEALDGTMFLESPRGAGTTLIAELPLVPTERAGHGTP
ncbi:sensor histidine kinase [Streptomyces sp. NPDC054794]